MKVIQWRQGEKRHRRSGIGAGQMGRVGPLRKTKEAVFALKIPNAKADFPFFTRNNKQTNKQNKLNQILKLFQHWRL